MKTQKFTQFGTFSVLLLTPLVLIIAGFLIKAGLASSPELYILIFLFLVFIICLMTFSKLTIIVDSTKISFKLGIGLFGKSYSISDIKSCEPVKNLAIYGVGIRIIPNGWLYNVTGLNAIELKFKNRKSVIRIGTNKPDEICALVQSILNNEPQKDIKSLKKTINPIWVILFLTLLLPIALFISSNQETKFELDNKSITIKGFYGQNIPLNEITKVDTVSKLPKIVMRTNGYAFRKTKTGYFKTEDKSHIKLFIKQGITPYIIIESVDREPIYINFKDRQKTIELFNELSIKK